MDRLNRQRLTRWPGRLARVTPTQAAEVSPVAEPEPAASLR
jgi:hypothetical protein